MESISAPAPRLGAWLVRPLIEVGASSCLILALSLLICLHGCGGDAPEDGCQRDPCGELEDVEPEAEGDGGGVAEGDVEDLVVSWETFEERPCPDENVLTFSNFGRGFMLSWCTGCHSSALRGVERAGAPEGTDFDRLPSIQAHASRIWARSADDNLTMPPVSGPGAQERFLLGQWLACGAPE